MQYITFNLFCYDKTLFNSRPTEIKKAIAERIGVKEHEINVSPKRVGIMNMMEISLKQFE